MQDIHNLVSEIQLPFVLGKLANTKQKTANQTAYGVPLLPLLKIHCILCFSVVP